MEIKVLTTPTCIKCKSLKPIMEKVSDNFNIKCEFLNALEETDLRNQFNVMSVPFIIFYKDGKVVFTYDGVLSEAQIVSIINDYNK